MSEILTVGRLKHELSYYDDDTPIEVAIHQDNKVYPVAYEPLQELAPSTRTLRLQVWLPEGMHTCKRKQ